MERSDVICVMIYVAVASIFIVGFGGLWYAGSNVVNISSSTKDTLEAMRYRVPDGMISTPTVVEVVPDFQTFLSIARQNSITTIYKEGLHFYIVVNSTIGYVYTLHASAWWIWG